MARNRVEVLRLTPGGRDWLKLLESLESDAHDNADKAVIEEFWAEGLKRFCPRPKGTRVRRNSWTGTKG